MRVSFGFGPKTWPERTAGLVAGTEHAAAVPGPGIKTMRWKEEMAQEEVTPGCTAEEAGTAEAAAVKTGEEKGMGTAATAATAPVAATAQGFRAEAPAKESLLPDIPTDGMPVYAKDPGTRACPGKNAEMASGRIPVREETGAGRIARIFPKPLFAGVEGFGMNELLSLAAALIIAAFVIIPELRKLASSLMSGLQNWWNTIISGRIFPNS